MLDQPALAVAAEAPDRDLDSILLHVDAAEQDQRAAAHRAAQVGEIAPGVDVLPLRRVRAFLPGPGELGVVECPQRLRPPA